MVFVSQSRKGQAEKDALFAHLRVLQADLSMVEVWIDDDIGGGDEAWEADIEAVERKWRSCR